ncbi:pitrilysin family protein [Gordonia jinhuaensis]|uniref:Zinc protease n=1 Tax=Gordonia jinhuaensis TaxID=1517702 RepID=A0A916T0Q6_9ACTN|nr:pitrilysin family protein [Gordonia jinhuaensis]GGB26483.1 putative zinc protease [Gordonia jinhuaensis]
MSRRRSATRGESGTIRRTSLPGGLRVVTEHVPAVRSASIGLWVGVGSRDERPALAGAAHFLEHLLFKSTPTRTAASIAEEMDAGGGELNAFTSKEHTCFYAHVLDDYADDAIDVIADVVLRGRCEAADVDLERDVVLEEIAMRDDDPEDLLGDIFAGAMFGDHPIGRPVIGSSESITAMSRAQVRSFHQRRYTPDRMVLSVAGNVEHRDVVRAARRAFAGRLDGERQPAHRRSGSRALTGRPGVDVVYRDIEQAHMLLGVRTAGRGSSDRWALSVLNAALGGGLSSRLYQEVREERGLAYSVYSGLDAYHDVGTFSVYAACSPARLADVAAVTRRVLSDVAEHGITDAECARAKGSLRGGLVLGLEDSQSRMHRLGLNELEYARKRPVSRSLSAIERVTPAQVRAVAAEVLTRPMGAAVVGPYRGVRNLPKAITELGR